MTAPDAQLPRRDFLGRALAALAGLAWFGRAGRAEAAPTGSGTPYVGEIKMFAGNFAPVGWMFCDGQLLTISENETLFNLIGTTYGGNGQETFALPDLRSRAPVHCGVIALAETGGQEELYLTVNQIPAHNHAAGASAANGISDDPSGRVPARSAAGVPQYGATADTTLAPAALLSAGGTGPHPNMQPYLGINYIISLFGVFPSPS